MDIETSGKNVTLRPMTQKEHRAFWRKYTPEPDSGQAYVYDEEKADKLFETLCENGDRCPTAGIFNKNGEIIGMIQLPNLVNSERRCDIYAVLANESYRGKGFGTEAVKLAVKYARYEMRISKIYAEISADNSRMKRVLEKNGFLNSRVVAGGCGDKDKLLYVLRF